MAGRGRPWPALASHGRPWPATARNGRPWSAMADPTIAGHGRSWPATASQSAAGWPRRDPCLFRGKYSIGTIATYAIFAVRSLLGKRFLWKSLACKALQFVLGWPARATRKQCCLNLIGVHAQVSSYILPYFYLISYIIAYLISHLISHLISDLVSHLIQISWYENPS